MGSSLLSLTDSDNERRGIFVTIGCDSRC